MKFQSVPSQSILTGLRSPENTSADTVSTKLNDDNVLDSDARASLKSIFGTSSRRPLFVLGYGVSSRCGVAGLWDIFDFLTRRFYQDDVSFENSTDHKIIIEVPNLAARFTTR